MSVLWWLFSRAGAVEVTFAQALDEAVERAPAVGVAEGEYRASVGAALASRAVVADPTVSAEVRPSEESVEGSVQLPLAGQPVAAATAAARARDAAEVRLGAATARAALTAGEAYLELERAELLAALAEESLALALRSREATARLLQSGEIGAVDAAVAASVTADAANRAGLTRQEVLRARRRLEVALGRDPMGEVSAAGWPQLEPPPASEVALPEARAAELDARAARASTTLARLQLIPSPQVGAGYTRSSDGNGLTLSLGVALPVFSPGIGAVRAASGTADRAAAASEQARLEALEAWRGGLADLDIARTAAELARVDGLAEALAQVNLGFEAGEYSLGEFVARRDAVLGGLIAQVEATFRVEQATLRLWQLLGELPPSTVTP